MTVVRVGYGFVFVFALVEICACAFVYKFSATLHVFVCGVCRGIGHEGCGNTVSRGRTHA